MVDDEPDAVDVLATVLRLAGAHVIPALSAEEALAQIAAEGPDLVISDPAMPDEDGFALIRAVRRLAPDAGGRTPVIALTAHARTEDRFAALAAGFDMHLAKPIESRELVLLATNLLRRSQPSSKPAPRSAAVV